MGRTINLSINTNYKYDELGNLPSYEYEQAVAFLALIGFVKSKPNLEGANAFLSALNDYDEPTSFLKEDGSRYSFSDYFRKHRDFLDKNKLSGLSCVIYKQTKISSYESRAFLESYRIVQYCYPERMSKSFLSYMGQSASQKRSIEIEEVDEDYY